MTLKLVAWVSPWLWFHGAELEPRPGVPGTPWSEGAVCVCRCHFAVQIMDISVEFGDWWPLLQHWGGMTGVVDLNWDWEFWKCPGGDKSCTSQGKELLLSAYMLIDLSLLQGQAFGWSAGWGLFWSDHSGPGSGKAPHSNASPTILSVWPQLPVAAWPLAGNLLVIPAWQMHAPELKQMLHPLDTVGSIHSLHW